MCVKVFAFVAFVNGFIKLKVLFYLLIFNPFSGSVRDFHHNEEHLPCVASSCTSFAVKHPAFSDSENPTSWRTPSPAMAASQVTKGISAIAWAIPKNRVLGVWWPRLFVKKFFLA